LLTANTSAPRGVLETLSLHMLSVTLVNFVLFGQQLTILQWSWFQSN